MSGKVIRDHVQASSHKLPNVLAAFMTGMLVIFTGALLYSQVEQGWSPLNTASVASGRVPSRPDNTGVVPNDTSARNSVRADEQEDMMARGPDRADQYAGTTHVDSGHAVENAGAALAQAALAGTAADSQPPQKQPDSESSVRASETVGVHRAETTSTSYAPPHPSEVRTQAPDQQLIAPSQEVANAPQPQYPDRVVGQYKSTSAPDASVPASVLPQPPSETSTPAPEPKQVTVERGTDVQVRLGETLSSDRNRTGDTFRATLASPLVVNGVVVAGTDSTVLGRVELARRAPLLGRKADLALTLTDIITPDGRAVKVETNNVDREGSRTGVVNTAKMATGATVGAVIGALTGAAEGAGISSSLKNSDQTNGFMATNRTVVLPAGTQVTFNLVSRLTLTRPKNH